MADLREAEFMAGLEAGEYTGDVQNVDADGNPLPTPPGSSFLDGIDWGATRPK